MARVVVITGGGSGIGAACARLMTAAGERVFITGRREAQLQKIADETGATALVGDAADGDVWRERLLPAILDQTGGIDVLICSAGGMGNSAAADTSDRQWREALDANLNSAFVSVRACLPACAYRQPRQCTVRRLHRFPCRRAAGLWLRHRQTRVNRPDALRRPRLRPTGRPRQCHLPRLGHHPDGG